MRRLASLHIMSEPQKRNISFSCSCFNNAPLQDEKAGRPGESQFELWLLSFHNSVQQSANKNNAWKKIIFLLPKSNSKCRYQNLVVRSNHLVQESRLSFCQKKFGFTFGNFLISRHFKRNVLLCQKPGWRTFEKRQVYLEKCDWNFPRNLWI